MSEHTPLWICIVDGEPPFDRRIRAWTHFYERASQLRADGLDMVEYQPVNSIDHITAELDGLASTVEVLESNARVQAKLLADTARKLATAFEDAAKVAEAHGAPYALQTNTGSMMFRAVTDKIAAGIRALASTECVASDE